MSSGEKKNAQSTSITCKTKTRRTGNVQSDTDRKESERVRQRNQREGQSLWEYSTSAEAAGKI